MGFPGRLVKVYCAALILIIILIITLIAAILIASRHLVYSLYSQLTPLNPCRAEKFSSTRAYCFLSRRFAYAETFGESLWMMCSAL